jgi:hypothetical protein
VVVRTGDETNAEAGAGIFVGPVSIGGRAATAESSEATSRIEFEVPIRYPNIEERTREGGLDLEGPKLAD